MTVSLGLGLNDPLPPHRNESSMRKIASILSALILACAGLALTAQPASAASTYITIYNSSQSFRAIAVNNGGGYVYPGGHTVALYNGNDSVRVDTDPTGAAHSYKINPVGAPVGPCHTNSDNHSSNPPNYAEVYYQTYDHGNCTN